MNQLDPNDFTDQFNTPIPPEKQAAFDAYVKAQKTNPTKPKDVLADRYDYDVQGDWLQGAKTDNRGHGSDQFKKPNHPTFSDQSQYSGVGGNVGGQWIDAPGRSFYQPSSTNLQHESPEELQRYFKDPRIGDTNITPLPPAAVNPPPLPPELVGRYKSAPRQGLK